MALDNSVNATRKRMIVPGLDDDDDIFTTTSKVVQNRDLQDEQTFSHSTIFRADDAMRSSFVDMPVSKKPEEQKKQTPVQQMVEKINKMFSAFQQKKQKPRNYQQANET